ncbi:VID27-like protein isoform X2 [Hylaeus volcanicus]|uniref:VID27-like protein isoform X2 n=1 Tax=Hylaeus volcanicus TaxID=313075 RepID=UPI0023B8725B|nr:VID27-like protein isoform X2 [Hylaeus volcanicus]
MFSFVKSLFLGGSSLEGTPADPLTPNMEKHIKSSSESSSVTSETEENSKHLTKISATRQFLILPEESKDEDLLKFATLKGALYSVDGGDVECLMESCNITIFENTINMTLASDVKGSHCHKLTIKSEWITNLQQHLPTAFRLLINDHQGKGGIEYTVQFKNAQEAAVFRKQIYEAIICMTCELSSVECAIAEYNTLDREFVIVSKCVVASILQDKTKLKFYLTIEEIKNNEKQFLFIDALSKDIQIWGSPTSNQITFWGVHHQQLNATKTMFLMEINPLAVGEASINVFFTQIARALHDPSFLRQETFHHDTTKEDQSDVDMEDDGFDVGQLANTSTCLEWKKNGRRSVARFRPPRHSYFSAESDASETDENSDKNDFQHPSKPLYFSGCSNEKLVHRFMEVGSSRMFVCRGDSAPDKSFQSRSEPQSHRLQLKVYKKENSDEEVVESVGIISGQKFCYQGKTFVPLKGLLHQHEKKMLLVPEGSKNGDIFMMDLETEKIVQKYEADDSKISTLFPTFKKAQASADPTFLCANPKELFLMDTRLNNGVAKTTSFNYSTNPQISVGATDSNKHILLGSRLGELRLFDGTANAKGDFKRAKTLLQTIREPIVAVDVNNDGSWILATTKTFLVVFPTRLIGSTKNGFETALGKKKPAPRYLMLTAEDILNYQITTIDFAAAKFDASEESIVTSTGNMAVVWDFESVKRNQPIYSIRFAQDSIKDVQIPTDSSNVVVAYSTAIGLFGTEKHELPTN